MKRVAVMSPQTRLAHSRRRLRGRWRVPRLDPADADRALRNYRMHRKSGATVLTVTVAFLLGLPVLLALLPWLTDVRVGDIPAAWLVLAVLPYPVMAAIARWHLRRAEEIEDS